MKKRNAKNNEYKHGGYCIHRIKAKKITICVVGVLVVIEVLLNTLCLIDKKSKLVKNKGRYKYSCCCY